MEVREGSPEQRAYLDELVEHGLLIPSGVPGVLGRGADFEAVRVGVGQLVGRAGRDEGAEALAFPPVLPREQLERLDYLASFPHLAGSIHAFAGGEDDARELAASAREHRGWSGDLEPSELVMLPAACHPVYPALARRGPLAPGGATVDTGDAWVFRHEPSTDPMRLQLFHMRELVRVGTPEDVATWRGAWQDRMLELLGAVGLRVRAQAASDPFFGRAGRLMARSQVQQGLKVEVEVDITPPAATAIASSNLHLDHFGELFGLRTADGATAHSACTAFGEERITLALLRVHGFDLAAWPHAVRELLGIS